MSILTTRADCDYIVFVNGERKIISLELGPVAIQRYNLKDDLFPNAAPAGATHFVHVEKIFSSLTYFIGDPDAKRELKSYEPYPRYKLMEEVAKCELFPVEDLYGGEVEETQKCSTFIARNPALKHKVFQCEYCLNQPVCQSNNDLTGLIGG